MTFLKTIGLPSLTAVAAVLVTAASAFADDGGSMQVPLATGAVGAVGLFGGLAAAASALWRRVR